MVLLLYLIMLNEVKVLKKYLYISILFGALVLSGCTNNDADSKEITEDVSPIFLKLTQEQKEDYYQKYVAVIEDINEEHNADLKLEPFTTFSDEDWVEVDTFKKRVKERIDVSIAVSKDKERYHPAGNKEVVNSGVVTEPEPIQGASESYYGEWIINKVQAYGIGTYSVEDAESLLGETLIFTADKASYFGERPVAIEKVATNPIYTETIISERDFEVGYRIPFESLGIKVPITEINVSDSNGYVSSFFIKDDNTLIITGGGTFFELIRKVSKNM